MFKKETALAVSVIMLGLMAVIDIFRGFMHTFNVRYAAENIAGINPTSDSLVIMGSFGISNLLTASIYFLIIFKARKLAPYVLALIPINYAIGAFGFLKVQQVAMESAFNGQYMMSIYIMTCFFTAIYYFTSA